MSTACVANDSRSSKSASQMRSTHSRARRRARSGLSMSPSRLERPRDHFDAFVVGRARHAVPAAIVTQGRTYEEVDRTDVVGEAAGLEQRLTVLGITRLSLRVTQAEEERRPTMGIVVPRPRRVDRARPGTSAAPRRARAAPGLDRRPVARTSSPFPRSAVERPGPSGRRPLRFSQRDRPRRSPRAPTRSCDEHALGGRPIARHGVRAR